LWRWGKVLPLFRHPASMAFLPLPHARLVRRCIGRNPLVQSLSPGSAAYPSSLGFLGRLSRPADVGCAEATPIPSSFPPARSWPRSFRPDGRQGLERRYFQNGLLISRTRRRRRFLSIFPFFFPPARVPPLLLAFNLRCTACGVLLPYRSLPLSATGLVLDALSGPPP